MKYRILKKCTLQYIQVIKAQVESITAYLKAETHEVGTFWHSLVSTTITKIQSTC